MPSNPCQAFSKVVELAFFAPIGAALFVRNDLPRIVRDRAQGQVALARFIGERAVSVGRERLVAATARDTSASGHDMLSADEVAVPVRPATEPAADVRIEPVADVGGRRSDLVVEEATPDPPEPAPGDGPVVAVPFDGYDSLAAAHIVQRLNRLDPSELLAVGEYERANRSRRTVLAKVDQLQGT